MHKANKVRTADWAIYISLQQVLMWVWVYIVYIVYSTVLPVLVWVWFYIGSVTTKFSNNKLFHFCELICTDNRGHVNSKSI